MFNQLGPMASKLVKGYFDGVCHILRDDENGNEFEIKLHAAIDGRDLVEATWGGVNCMYELTDEEMEQIADDLAERRWNKYADWD